MFNEDTIKGKWKEIKGEIRTHWGKMTEDELEQTSGNFTSITGIIQQRYGSKKEEIQQMLHTIASKFTQKSVDLKTQLKKD